ncbi:hypothetical protein SAY86_009919 [Trapa natans]|uniref:Uncharacterized protein n=1 Tax=Trapa natans TaxID=22666 RepID=A0AAN7KZB8_TRANT|nr:hypothetical protein SAY86_009919 [Trapa natans]
MILRSTRKFFIKTFGAVRSFISGIGADYRKLPKDSNSCSNYGKAYSQGSHSELDKFYAEFSDLWDAEKMKKARGKKKKKKKSGLHLKGAEEEVRSNNNAMISHHIEGRREDDPSSGRSKKRQLIAKKLKELEMVDASNIDHVLDIEEFWHYYSLLTCQVYEDIVDNFFMEINADLAGENTALGSSSRPISTGQ